MGGIPFERKGDYDGIHFREHRMRRLCGAVCVILCVLLVFVVVVLGIATLVAYLILRPHATRYNVVSATVPTFEVVGTSNSLTSSSAVNAQFVYGVEARNPNRRVSMEYSDVHVQTTYLGTDVGHGNSGTGFRVGHHGAFVVTIATSAMRVVVSNIVGDALRSNIARQSVRVRVRIDTRARARVGSYTSFWIWLHAACDVDLAPPSGGVAGALLHSDCHNS